MDNEGIPAMKSKSNPNPPANPLDELARAAYYSMVARVKYAHGELQICDLMNGLWETQSERLREDWRQVVMTVFIMTAQLMGEIEDEGRVERKEKK